MVEYCAVGVVIGVDVDDVTLTGNGKFEDGVGAVAFVVVGVVEGIDATGDSTGSAFLVSGAIMYSLFHFSIKSV